MCPKAQPTNRTETLFATDLCDLALIPNAIDYMEFIERHKIDVPDKDKTKAQRVLTLLSRPEMTEKPVPWAEQVFAELLKRLYQYSLRQEYRDQFANVPKDKILVGVWDFEQEGWDYQIILRVYLCDRA